MNIVRIAIPMLTHIELSLKQGAIKRDKGLIHKPRLFESDAAQHSS